MISYKFDHLSWTNSNHQPFHPLIWEAISAATPFNLTLFALTQEIDLALEKNSCCEEKFFLWRKTACFEENLATLFLSPLLLVSRPPPAHICARFYPFHLFLTIMPPPTPSLVTAPLIHLSSQLSHILCDTFYPPPHPPRKIVTTSL